MMQDLQGIHINERLKMLLDLFELDEIALNGETKSRG